MGLRKRDYILEGGNYSINIATVPLARARKYAEAQFEAAGKKLDDVLPNFDENYVRLQKAAKKAPDIPRINMPVIEPTDMKRFDKDLQTGQLDILKPFAKGKLHVPKNLDTTSGKEWIGLGLKDGKKADDQIKAKWTSIAADKLKPTQSQIWLEKVIGMIIKFGVPGAGSPVLTTTVIVSKSGFILDGHHRYGQVMIAKPSLKMKALHIPIGIKRLVKVGRAYGNAIGNRQKA